MIFGDVMVPFLYNADYTVKMNRMDDSSDNQFVKPDLPKNYRWTWRDILWIGLISVSIMLISAFSVGKFFRIDFVDNSSEYNPSLILNAALVGVEGFALFFSVWFVGVVRKKLTCYEIGFRPVNRKWWIAGIIILILVMPVIALVALSIQKLLDLPLQNPQLPFLSPKQFSWIGAISMLVLGGVFVPIAEELMFRGVIYQMVRERYGIWIGIIVSSLIFGALHMEISVAGATFVMGLFLAWMYERSGSLWPSILVHGMNNFLQLLFLYALIGMGIPLPA